MFGSTSKAKKDVQKLSSDENDPQQNATQEEHTPSNINDSKVDEKRLDEEGPKQIVPGESTVSTKHTLYSEPESDNDKDSVSDDDFGLPWYEEHKEALILSCLGFLAYFGMITIRGTRSK